MRLNRFAPAAFTPLVNIRPAAMQHFSIIAAPSTSRQAMAWRNKGSFELIAGDHFRSRISSVMKICLVARFGSSCPSPRYYPFAAGHKVSVINASSTNAPCFLLGLADLGHISSFRIPGAASNASYLAVF